LSPPEPGQIFSEVFENHQDAGCPLDVTKIWMWVCEASTLIYFSETVPNQESSAQQDDEKSAASHR